MGFPAYFRQKKAYEKMLGIDSDPKCKDITRLCFISDDPETYKNIHNQIFEVTIPEAPFSIATSKKLLAS